MNGEILQIVSFLEYLDKFFRENGILQGVGKSSLEERWIAFGATNIMLWNICYLKSIKISQNAVNAGRGT